ncbi:hypothetical protein GCM10027340_00650 [Marinomonas epiphytica]
MAAVANSSDEPAFPLLFTWSTHQAQIKEVLVSPDDSWLDNHSIETNSLDLDEQQLYEFGYEAGDILAEWINEFDTDVVYAFEPDVVGILVEEVFNTKNMPANFEVASIYSWFNERDIDLTMALEDQGLHTPLHLLPPDEAIGLLLELAASHDLIDISEIEAE